MKVDILAFGAHPDDVELSCSGTLLRHIDMGKKVGLIDLTRGELGSRGSADLRDQEAATSAKLMGASFRENLRLADGFFTYDQATLLKVIQAIRQHQPEIVLANSLSDRHPDHGRAAKLVSDACFYAGLLRIETADNAGKVQTHWRPSAVYHYIQDKNLEPDFVVDITEYIDKKIELVQTFRSQFFQSDAAEYADEPETPISSAGFMNFLKSKSATMGRPANFDFAEGFQVGRTPGVQNLFDLS
ncbi:MAG: bacillithiol biosynthesis deacetylase BshB1 [Saprospiraceae bacterium]|nr:bacillithiol biosynthesis deacetylase BshB1 [Saprospiraceae bacterium]